MAKLLGFDRGDLRMEAHLFVIGVKDRYLGSTLGLVWAVANPLIMLGLFTFVFGYVYKARLPGASTELSYVTWLISGYGPWLGISESITSGTMAVVANAALVKNLAFKAELLPIQGVLMGCIPLLVGLTFVAVLLAVSGQPPQLAWLIVLFAVVIQFVLVAGVVFVLSALNVFIRDIGLMLGNLLLILLFVTPIFYPSSSFPARVRFLAELNPLYVLSQAYRLPLLEGRMPEPWQLGYLTALSLALFVAGLAFFRRLKHHFDSRL